MDRQIKYTHTRIFETLTLSSGIHNILIYALCTRINTFNLYTIYILLQAHKILQHTI